MMAVFGGVERTSAQWEEIFSEAGLRVSRRWAYDERTGDGVMELEMVRVNVDDVEEG